MCLHANEKNIKTLIVKLPSFSAVIDVDKYRTTISDTVNDALKKIRG